MNGKKSVVVVEDEQDIASSLKYFLEKNDIDVVTFGSAEEFFAAKNVPDQCIYLVDWNLPGIKGIDIIKTLRLRDKLSPLFMLSANIESAQIIEGLQAGADDYITKPFNYDELLIRIKNALTKFGNLKDNMLNVGLKLIPEAHSVMMDGVTVSLTSREFIIFQHLHNHRNAPSTREELINQFENDSEMTARNIDVHIFSLRKKMNKIKIGIETVWGTGYRLVN
jgi:DNA-binding response OmpR family regulator